MLRKLFPKLGLAAASLLVMFVLAEIVARALEPGPFSLWDRRPYEHHPELPHVHAAGFSGRWDGTWYEIDSRGLRGPEIADEPASNEVRVVAVGDSCTFGKGVREQDTWPRQLEALLDEHLAPDRDAVVANLGTNGFSGKDYLRMVELRGLALQPDLVLVGYNLNDFPNVIRKVDRQLYKGSGGVRRAVPKGVRDALGRLAIVRLARSTYYEMGREAAYARAEQLAAEVQDQGYAEALAQQEEYLRELVEVSRAAGAEVAVFLFPYESQVYRDEYDTTPIDRLREACERLDVVFVDLAEEFRRHVRSKEPEPRLFIRGDRYHPNPEGYGIVARRVFDAVLEAGWLDDPSR